MATCYKSDSFCDSKVLLVAYKAELVICHIYMAKPLNFPGIISFSHFICSIMWNSFSSIA